MLFLLQWQVFISFFIELFIARDPKAKTSRRKRLLWIKDVLFLRCVRVVFAMRVGGNRRAQYCIMHQRVENMDKWKF